MLGALLGTVCDVDIYTYILIYRYILYNTSTVAPEYFGVPQVYMYHVPYITLFSIRQYNYTYTYTYTI